MDIDAIRAVQEAAATNSASDFEHEHSAPELQAAVAKAVTNGLPINDVASAAHMTALAVLDAADRHTYSVSYATKRPPARGVPVGPD